MATMLETAKKFFEACETGKGWEGCKAYCTADATFSAQSNPLLEVKTLAGYADWMKGMFTPFPDGSYDLKSFAVDEDRKNVSAFAVFKAREHRARRAGAADRQVDRFRLRLRHAVQWRRQDRPHDEDLERRHRAEAGRLALTRAVAHGPRNHDAAGPVTVVAAWRDPQGLRGVGPVRDVLGQAGQDPGDRRRPGGRRRRHGRRAARHHRRRAPALEPGPGDPAAGLRPPAPRHPDGRGGHLDPGRRRPAHGTAEDRSGAALHPHPSAGEPRRRDVVARPRPRRLRLSRALFRVVRDRDTADRGLHRRGSSSASTPTNG